jgi:hypothetical protein
VWKYIKDNGANDKRNFHGAYGKGNISGTDGEPASGNILPQGSAVQNAAQLTKSIKRHQPARSADPRRTKIQQTASEVSSVSNDVEMADSGSSGETTKDEDGDLEVSAGPGWKWNNVAIKNEADEEWEDDDSEVDDEASVITTGDHSDTAGMRDAVSPTPATNDASSVAMIRDAEVDAQITAEQDAAPASHPGNTFTFKQDPDDDDETMADVPSREATPDDDPTVSSYSWISDPCLGGLFNSIDDAALIQ